MERKEEVSRMKVYHITLGTCTIKKKVLTLEFGLPSKPNKKMTGAIPLKTEGSYPCVADNFE